MPSNFSWVWKRKILDNCFFSWCRKRGLHHVPLPPFISISIFIQCYLCQCCGSMTFWCGSGSADPCLWLMDPDPSIFIIDLQDATKNYFKKRFFLHITFWRYFYIILQKLRVKKKSQNSRNQCFSYYFCLMIEGSRSGSIFLTNGSASGSRRPKNMWIRWIRIRIRIHNTDLCYALVM